MTINEQVEECIRFALKTITEENKNLALRLIKDQTFITNVAVYDPNRIAVKVNGIIQYPTQTTNYIMIDFTKKLMLDPEQFKFHSQMLYNKFSSIQKWYDC